MGYLASIIIGISLGLIGGGGSILTVPVLVYLFRIDVILATTYSLFVVGLTSAVGSVSYFSKGLVNARTALFFGIPSVVAVFFTRKFILSAIPSHLFDLRHVYITKDTFLIVLFAILMVLASYSMIKKNAPAGKQPNEQDNHRPFSMVIKGLVVGMLTGLVGAGGGFLIIPALVIISKLSMKKAIGTSLVIITANSVVGFFSKQSDSVIDWFFLLQISAFAIAGIFIGMAISKKIDGSKLKPAFGWFVLVTGICIIVKETVFK